MAAPNQSMFEVMEALNKRMAQFESELQKTPPARSTDSLASEFTAFKEFTVQVLRAFQLQLNGLAREVDQQEMRSRRKILLLHGVPEDDKEDCADTVTKTIITKLKVDFNTDCIGRCQRMGRASQDKPRPLLVKFKELALRNKVWLSKTNLKGSGISLSEFLTKPRHEAFMAARQRFGLTKCWTRDGYVHVLGPDGTRYRVTSLAELHQIASSAAKPAVVLDPLPPRSSRRAAEKATKKQH